MIVYRLAARAGLGRRPGLTAVGMVRACILLTMPVCLWGTNFGAAAETPPPRAARSVHLWYPAQEGVVYYNEVTV
ncbi:MAG TPA: hypothetical protein VMW24_00575, partial [Sedimentisphaerales bacterium]|nr:hypothetical protein [Sedimentisphaerales bacterium]